MTCDEAEILLHALIDGELDAGHAREVETHIAGCPRCAAQLAAFRDMRAAMADVRLNFTASPSLRRRIDTALPQPALRDPSRRALLKGFGLGTAVSAAAAAGVVAMLFRADEQQRVLGDVVSAHLRSLQAEHLIDVQSSDQHTVKPWFNGRLDIAPPVVDLTAQGFTLIGGRLDYIDGKPVAAIVYRRRIHVINLFVMPAGTPDLRGPRTEVVQGFNIRRWNEPGFALLAISDLNAEELQEFSEKFERALHTNGT